MPGVCEVSFGSKYFRLVLCDAENLTEEVLYCGLSSNYSDKPGMHDFNVLKKLVLPDGSILRGKYAGRPTRDCLFVDTVMDGKR